LLSDDDLKLMIEEASADGSGAVNLETFLGIMEYSPWY
jgi:Ca2+-binding EF-hand superfamily protein